MQIQNKVADISFLNIFTKKLVFRLAILLVISIAILIPAQSITERACENYIEKEQLATSLSLIELIDTNIAKDRIEMYSNIQLAQLKENLENHQFIKNASVSLYNDTAKELVSRSVEIPAIFNQDVIDWWKENARVDYGFPTISVNDDLTTWCHENENYTIIVKKMFYSNFVLFPTELKAMDGDKMVSEYTVTTPSLTQSVYEKDCELQLIGNQINDHAYRELYDFRFLVNDNNESVFSYPNFSEENKLTLDSKSFTINEKDYHMDVVYQVSFWEGALLYVVLFELVGILTAAVLAFINTKETLSMFN